MNPKIIAIAGPLRGLVVEVVAGETSLGRDEANTLSIQDKAVSRHHCLIKGEEGAYKIVDLESHNGTFINDVPINEQIMRHGDRIKVGGSYFLFVTTEERDAASSQDMQLDQDMVVTGSTLCLRFEDIISSLARDLGVLMNISDTLSSAPSLAELQQQVLELVLDVIPAERGALLLAEEGLDSHVKSFVVNKHPASDSPVHVSRTVVQQVLKEGVAILSYDIKGADFPIKSESLLDSKICSLLCVPLRLRNRVIGVLYLDTSTASFSESHLRLAAAIAGFAAGALENARHVERLEHENQMLRSDMRLEHNMIGESPKMKKVYQDIARAAPTESTVLILGESGTGKELAARAIHQSSLRADKPFVAINCAALTETLLESELFGYEKGAFTGANAKKEGKLEAADGGTVFLDEIGEMPLQLQTKLLRVLQEREFDRVGGTRPRKINIRIIAATNKDLEATVAHGNFRQDLYFRLNVIPLTMPPLRERPQDVLLLANYFVTRYSDKCKRPVSGLSTAARECLINYDWPGNVRELENAMERAVVLGLTEQILAEDLPEAILESGPQPAQPKFHEAIQNAKRRLITSALEEAGGNYTKAAKLLGIHPNNLHRLIRNLKPEINK